MLQLFVIGLLLALVLIIFSRALIKSRQQSRLMSLQSKEIQKHVLELEQRNRELEKLNLEKVQIISIVAHDLKGPFNRIFALTQLMSLSQQSLGAEQQEYLGKIHQIAADGLGMVRNVLDSKKFDERGITLNVISLDLALLVSSAIKNHRVVAGKKNIEIIPEFSGALVVETDKLYVGRVIDNLLANAIKFSPEEKKIFVRLIETENAVVLSVRDQGPGISNEDQKKLFQRFQQLSARPTGGESSTGLGLFIVKTIVEKIGGEITCESVLGEGACFTLRTPKVQLKK